MDCKPPVSYEPDEVVGGFAEEIERLRAQVDMSWDVERRRLVELGVRDGQRLLEVGCGPGFMTARLACAFPNATIVGIDTDARLLGVAAEQTSAYANRVRFLHADASATGLENGAFDGALTRYVYQHLADPVAAAVETRRLLRPAGYHLVIDIDDALWGLVEPEAAIFRHLHQKRGRDQANRGGNRHIGRRLGRILRAAGYVDVLLDMFAYHSDDVGMSAFARQLAPDQFLPLLERGQVSFGEYAQAVAATQAFLESRDAFLLMTGFIARGEKPR